MPARKGMPLIICLLVLLFSFPAHARIKTYTYTIKQPFGGSQSPDDARIAGIAKAKREILEMAGTYLETLTLVKQGRLDKDDIIALAAGVLKVEVVSQKNYASGDAFGIEIKVKADVDTSVLEKRVKQLLDDRKWFEKYKESTRREKELLAKVKRLEEEEVKKGGIIIPETAKETPMEAKVIAGTITSSPTSKFNARTPISSVAVPLAAAIPNLHPCWRAKAS
jgi:hypothetical protein